MVKKDNLRIDKFAVGALAAGTTKIADKNTNRWKLRITCPDGRLYVGLDRAVELDTAYCIASQAELRIEMYKGEVWAFARTAPAIGRDVFVYEESKEG